MADSKNQKLGTMNSFFRFLKKLQLSSIDVPHCKEIKGSDRQSRSPTTVYYILGWWGGNTVTHALTGTLLRIRCIPVSQLVTRVPGYIPYPSGIPVHPGIS